MAKNENTLEQDLKFWQENPELYINLGAFLITKDQKQNILDPDYHDIFEKYKSNEAYEAFQEAFKQIAFVAVFEDVFLGYVVIDNQQFVVSFDFKYLTVHEGNLTEVLFNLYAKKKSGYNVWLSYSKNKNDQKQYQQQQSKQKKIYEGLRTKWQEQGIEIRAFGFSCPVYEKHEEAIENWEHYFEYELVDIYKHGRDISQLGIQVSESDIKKYRNPKFGTKNPTKIDSKFWQYGIAKRNENGTDEGYDGRLSAYALNEKFNSNIKKESYCEKSPTWCFNRLGRTLTRVDNKEIYIAGEHEDGYDPDFNIYNDVVVVDENDNIDIYTYPENVFPPTDFHSATLIKPETILIIGNLGYSKNRQHGKTQVLSLNIKTFEIQQIETFGENPGWIHEHRAVLSKDKQSVIINGGKIDEKDQDFLQDNLDTFALNLTDMKWSKITTYPFPNWSYARKDKKRNAINEIRSYYNYDHKREKDNYYKKSIWKALGYLPAEKLLKQLYDIDGFETEYIEKGFDDHRVVKIKINGVSIKIKEDWHTIKMVAEGEISEENLQKIQQGILKNLEAIEQTDFEVLVLTYM